MDKPTALRMSHELNGRHVGGWLIGDLLGSGGSAVVLKATRDGDECALKIIDPALEVKYGAEKQEVRVGYELQLVGRRHPHLVQIYDGGRCQHTKFLFVAMEYLPFKNLDEMRGRIPAGKVAQLIDQIAQAARFLEELDICHRDIKPENIAVTEDCERAILLDLGILRPTSQDDIVGSGTGSNFIGTVRYSPPEFVWRREEDSVQGYRAITFYQIGGVLHDLITGRRLFEEVSAPLARLIEGVANQVPEIDSDSVSARIVNLARDCLHKDWKIRTQLVNWELFDTSTHSKSNARERVRAIFEASSGVQSPILSNQSRRDRLELIGRSMRDQLRSICLKNADLPRAAVDFSVTMSGACVWAEFEASQAHGLVEGVRVTFEVTPMDDQILNVSARGSWGLATHESLEAQRVAILRSVDDDIADQLEGYLYEAIANGMGNSNPVRGSPIRLS